MDLLSQLFRIEMDPVELVLRGSTMYWFLFVLFRFVLRRDVGSIAIADVLLLVLIADASQNAMAGEYKTVGEGLLLVGTIAAWNYLVDWASFHSEPLRRLLEPRPLPLVRQGRLLRANLRRELITVDELRAQLRAKGIEDIAQVALAQIESDGEITVLPAAAPGARRKPSGA